jgi:hypothetical protein
MSLMKRQPSPAQSRASRANSRRSTGPRTARGKATARRNALRPRALSPLLARSLRALGEQPGNFDEMHQALAAALEPRDAWEAAWVQDIARLRARLERLQRAELGSLAVRQRESWCRRQREKLPPGGSATLATGNLIGLVGFTGIADSPLKYERLSWLPRREFDAVLGEIRRGLLTTVCPNNPKKSEAENLLKIKGKSQKQLLNEAENILKIKPVTKYCRTAILRDRLSG